MFEGFCAAAGNASASESRAADTEVRTSLGFRRTDHLPGKTLGLRYFLHGKWNATITALKTGRSTAEASQPDTAERTAPVTKARQKRLLIASRLSGPGPAALKYSQMKQNRTASSPPFTIGHVPRGMCALKYATAISPASTNATGRVNSPSNVRTPPTISITPATPNSDVSGMR